MHNEHNKDRKFNDARRLVFYSSQRLAMLAKVAALAIPANR
jgi:hypothetical protein